MFDIKVYSPDDFPKYLPKLNDLYDDLFSGGKGFRSKLVKTVAKRLELKNTTTHLLCQTIEFIHNASLLHDDLIDKAPLRRNKTTAWLKYSPEYAVLAGDYLLARVMVNLSRYGNIQLIQFTSQIISDLLEGEWLQDGLIKDHSVDMDRLDQVHKLKTASLFEWCIRAPFIAIENYEDELHKNLKLLGNILGRLFQRGDDLLDYDIRNYENKNPLGDLKGGYFNTFGAFLVEGKSDEFRQGLFKINSLTELKEYVGEDYFQQKLDSFDQMNEDLIHEYHKTLDSIESLLQGKARNIVKDFRPLAELLYWRKK